MILLFLLEQVRTIDRIRLRGYVGSLSGAMMRKVDEGNSREFWCNSTEKNIKGVWKRSRRQEWVRENVRGSIVIDAPEDRNGALKSQFKQLIDYGEQMGFELVGSSSDVGTTPLWNRNGFRHFIEAVQKEQVDVLLIVNRGRLSRSSMQLARFQILQEKL